MCKRVPIHAPFSYIYPGPHYDELSGKLDSRVWFGIPVELDVDKNTITYVVFPFGGLDHEVTEITIEAPTSWIG